MGPDGQGAGPAPYPPPSRAASTHGLALPGAPGEPWPLGGVLPLHDLGPGPALGFLGAEATLLTLHLPAGFFPRAEAVTKLQFEPSGNRETSRHLRPGFWAASWCPRSWSPRGHRCDSEAGPGCLCSGSPIPGMTRSPGLTPGLLQGLGAIQPRDKCQRPQARGGVDSRAGTAISSDCRWSQNRALASPREGSAPEPAGPSWPCMRGTARPGWGHQARTEEQSPAARVGISLQSGPPASRLH